MTSSIDRRSFATGLAFGGPALVLGGAAASATGPALDDAALESPANLHRVYRRLRFAADERIVFWWMKGRRYGFVDTVIVGAET